MSEHHKAFYTVEESEVGNLYYFAPLTRAAGPFKEQRHVEAIIDIDAAGCLAGVELIDKMPAPPKAPPMTAPADSRISDERLEERLNSITLDENGDVRDGWILPLPLREAHALITELRERRAAKDAEIAELDFLLHEGGTWEEMLSKAERERDEAMRQRDALREALLVAKDAANSFRDESGDAVADQVIVRIVAALKDEGGTT